MLGIREIIVVAIGAAIGSVARYKLGGAVLHHTSSWNFPLSTFSVNVFGCLVIGVLAALVEHHDLLSAQMRLFLLTGLLGGFTTFSAFGYETIFLIRRGLAFTSMLYVGLSLVCGLAAVFIGFKAIELFWPAHR